MMCDRQRSRRLAVVVGAGMWLGGFALTTTSVCAVYARTRRACVRIELMVPAGHGLAPGDAVYAVTDQGLARIGEVAGVTPEVRAVRLDLAPAAASRLTTSTSATCWQTPLSVEESVDALLPPVVQSRVAKAIASDWAENREEWAAAWGALAGELASAYLEAISDDVAESFRQREEELWLVAHRHGQAFGETWPAIQQRLSPILQKHLTPVLSRLMHAALEDAPKSRIAWQFLRGRTVEAFRRTLDWLSDYLAQMPDEDRAELAAAIGDSWAAAGDDPELMAMLRALGRSVRDDVELRSLLTDVYREAIVDNPRTREFLRDQVWQSPRVRAQMYRSIESFGPTARRVAGLCLFDESGSTRPEVVHWLRSAALRRHIAWVTLSDGDANDPPLASDTVLHATTRGGS